MLLPVCVPRLKGTPGRRDVDESPQVWAEGRRPTQQVSAVPKGFLQGHV